MWANAQRNGHPAEYRWHPLFNTAKFGWRPLLECRAVTLPRDETRWNLQGAPNSRTDLSRYWAEVHHVMRTCGGGIAVSQVFFPIVDTCLSCEDTARQSCAMVPSQGDDFLHPVLSASHMQHISDLHSKFALRPHHVWKYGRHPVCDHWD